MLIEKRLKLAAAVGATIAALVGAYFKVFPRQVSTRAVPTVTGQTSQTQTGGMGNTQIGGVTGNVIINSSAPTPGIAGPKDPIMAARVDLQKLGVQWNSPSFVGAIVDG